MTNFKEYNNKQYLTISHSIDSMFDYTNGYVVLKEDSKLLKRKTDDFEEMTILSFELPITFIGNLGRIDSQYEGVYAIGFDTAHSFCTDDIRKPENVEKLCKKLIDYLASIGE